jgi:hypothetical protein
VLVHCGVSVSRKMLIVFQKE